MLGQETHPYYPLSAHLPHYVPNSQSRAHFLSLFAALFGAVVLLAWKSTGIVAHIRGKDRFAAAWFASCGFLHILFEGYLILHHDTLAGQNTLFSQTWKEYCLGDSRYLLSDPFVISIETITVFLWGPLCLLTSLAVLARAPSRHLLQVIVCVAHMYGVTLYIATETASESLRGTTHVRPEALYYWGYFVGANIPWLLVPLYLLKDSHDQIVEAFKALNDIDEVKDTATAKKQS